MDSGANESLVPDRIERFPNQDHGADFELGDGVFVVFALLATRARSKTP